MPKQSRGKLDDTLAAMFSNAKYRNDYLFYAHMIGQCSIRIREDFRAPAGVSFKNDHYILHINPPLFDTFELEERLAILKHEMLHILYNHLDRLENRVFMGWNISTDCAINQHISGHHLPDECITPKSIKKNWEIDVPLNESAERYYDLLKEEFKNKQKENSQNSEGDGDGDGDSGMADPFGNCEDFENSHETWLESTGDEELRKDLTKKMIEKAQENTIKSKGKIPMNCSEWIELHSTKAEINWKKVLRGIVGNKKIGKRTTIMKSDRRFPKREDLRGKVKDRKFNLLVVADVSGSMSENAIVKTIAEVKHICDITKTSIDLIQIDTEAYAPEQISKKTKIFNRKGHGGTTLSPALEMASKHNIEFNAVVVLTDGGLWGNDIEKFKELNKKVIWLIESNGEIRDEMNEGKMQAFKLKE